MRPSYKNQKCGVVDCDRKAVSRGCCDKHYRLLMRHGDPDYVRRRAIAEPRVCPTCGTAFTPPRKNRERVFCSLVCMGRNQKNVEMLRRIAADPTCRAKSRAAQAGKGEGKAYRKFYGRHEHRHVAEYAVVGRPLAANEIVHHIDGNILNNAPENLEVMTQSEHIRSHGLPHMSHEERMRRHDLHVQESS